MEYIYLVDRTKTTTEDDRSDFDTSDFDTGMFDHQVCNFYWGGMGWIILEVFPFILMNCIN